MHRNWAFNRKAIIWDKNLFCYPEVIIGQIDI